MSTLPNPFNTLQTFSANGASHQFYSLPALEKAGFNVSRLPVSIRRTRWSARSAIRVGSEPRAIAPPGSG